MCSSDLILPYFRQSIAITNKLGSEGFDPVTEADRNAEHEIRKLIRSRYPSHGIMGEEHGHEAGTSGLTWIVDPVDGTRAFMCGMTQWGTLIALHDGDRPVIGILDQPFLRERWISAGGKTVFRDHAGGERLLTARRCASLSQAVLTTTSPVGYFNSEEQDAFWMLSGRSQLTRFGGDCYAYGLLAMGFVDVVVEAGLQPWDIQALIPIIEGAGGVVTDWQGKPVTGGGRVVACGDPQVHAEALGVLAAVRAAD